MSERKFCKYLFKQLYNIGLITILFQFMVTSSIASNNISVNTTPNLNQSIIDMTNKLATGNISSPSGAINQSNETPIFTPMPSEPPYRPSPSYVLSYIVEVAIFIGVILYISKKKQ